MHYLDYNEHIQHRTGNYPMAFYPVDIHHERYRMPMHWHREAELIRVTSGRLSLYLDDRALVLGPGDMVLIGEGVIHGGEPEDCVYQCVVFDTALLTREEACKGELRRVLGHIIAFRAKDVDPALSTLFDVAAGGIEGRALRVTGALYSAFGALYKSLDRAEMSVEVRQFSQKAEQLKPALEYIETHYGQSITLDTLARQSGLSPKYFCRFFRTIVHRSPIDYVNYYRVECASHFLTATDMTVAEIAQHCGYSDSSFFIKQFKKYKGVTPKQYRL